MFNLSTAFIDFFAWLGWASELKTVPDEIIRKRVLRTGDGTHPYFQQVKAKHDENNNVDKLRDTEHFWGFVSVFNEILGVLKF
jgi:stearoyl-CoA desaturase (delta-9 desaturase)